MIWCRFVFIKLEYHGPFDMHGEYDDHTIVQYTELKYFDTNTYD